MLRSFVTEKGRGVDSDDEYINTHIEQTLLDEGIFYIEARDTVSSREFWEAYFAKNPSKRPSKVIYYKEKDPTDALKQWRTRHGIDKKAEDKNLGFSERSIHTSSPQATVGIDRFRSLAEQAIEDYFQREATSR